MELVQQVQRSEMRVRVIWECGCRNCSETTEHVDTCTGRKTCSAGWQRSVTILLQSCNENTPFSSTQDISNSSRLTPVTLKATVYKSQARCSERISGVFVGLYPACADKLDWRHSLTGQINIWHFPPVTRLLSNEVRAMNVIWGDLGLQLSILEDRVNKQVLHYRFS